MIKTLMYVCFLFLLGINLYSTKITSELRDKIIEANIKDSLKTDLILTYDLLTMKQNDIIDTYQSSRNKKLADNEVIELMFEISEKWENLENE